MHIHKNRLVRALALAISLLMALSCLSALGESEQAIVLDASIKVYSDSGLSVKVGTLSLFDTVNVTDVNGGVARVTSEGRVGYVSVSDIQFIKKLAEESVVNTNTLVYVSPTRSSKSFNLFRGEEVNLLATNGGWALIEQTGKIGFVSTDVLTKKNGSAVATSTPTPSPTKNNTPSDESVVYERFPAWVNVTILRAYKDPDSSSRQVGQLTYGERVNVQAYNDSWAYVEYMGNYGFMQKSGLSLTDNTAQAATPAPTPTPTPTPTPAPADDRVVYAAFTAWVNVSLLRAYKDPDLSSRQVGQLSFGAQVTVQAYNDDWAYVDYKGNTGFMQRSGLSLSDVSATPTATPTSTPTPAPTICDGIVYETYTASVSARLLAAFESPDASSRRVGQLAAGALVTVEANDGAWAYVEYMGNHGYMSLSGLIRCDAGIEATPEATPEATAEPTPTPTPTPVPTPTPEPTPSNNYLYSSSLSNQQKIHAFLTTEMHMTSAAACGVLANIRAESNFKVDIWNSSHISYGLCQWTYGRLTRLQNWCANNGYDHSTLEGQLYYLKYELENHYKKTLSYMLSVPNTAQGAYDAGYYWCYNFEVPSNRASKSVTRGNSAMNNYWPLYN